MWGGGGAAAPIPSSFFPTTSSVSSQKDSVGANHIQIFLGARWKWGPLESLRAYVIIYLLNHVVILIIISLIPVSLFLVWSPLNLNGPCPPTCRALSASRSESSDWINAMWIPTWISGDASECMWICGPTKVITSPHGLACNQILNHGIKNEKEEARDDFSDKYDTLASNVFS